MICNVEVGKKKKRKKKDIELQRRPFAGKFSRIDLG